MVDFVVEDGVPLPSEFKGGAKRGGFNDALRKLSVGQSVFRPNVRRKAIGGAIQYITREDKSKKFVARTVDGGVRIWRCE